MSNQRETITAHIETLLEGITKSTAYNTTPHVYRKREHWIDTDDFPALFLDEGEIEDVEHFCFGMEQGRLNLIILGRIKGDWKGLNDLIYDVRRRLDDSSENDYWQWTDILSVNSIADPSSDLKEFEMKVRIPYQYNTDGSDITETNFDLQTSIINFNLQQAAGTYDLFEAFEEDIFIERLLFYLPNVDVSNDSLITSISIQIDYSTSLPIISSLMGAKVNLLPNGQLASDEKIFLEAGNKIQLTINGGPSDESTDCTAILEYRIIAATITDKSIGADQIATASLDLQQVAGTYDLFECVKNSIYLLALIIKMPDKNISDDANITSINIQTNDSTPIVLISSKLGVKANLTAEKQLYYSGIAYVEIGKKIQLIINGGAADEESVCEIIAHYRAAGAEGYLSGSSDPGETTISNNDFDLQILTENFDLRQSAGTYTLFGKFDQDILIDRLIFRLPNVDVSDDSNITSISIQADYTTSLTLISSSMGAKANLTPYKQLSCEGPFYLESGHKIRLTISGGAANETTNCTAIMEFRTTTSRTSDRSIGKDQISIKTIDLNQAAGTYDLFTASYNDIYILGFILQLPDINVSNDANITSISIQTDDSTPMILIPSLMGAKARLTEENQLSYGGLFFLNTGQKIQLTINGGAADESTICNAIAHYRTSDTGGYLT